MPVLPSVEAGDRRGALEALARKLASAIDSPETPARDLASLALRLSAVLSELSDGDESGGSIDDLAARRARRRPDAAAQ